METNEEHTTRYPSKEQIEAARDAMSRAGAGRFGISVVGHGMSILDAYEELAQAALAAAEIVHATIDLKAMHEGKTEVQWTLNGGWLKVIRWNRKSVTVNMAGERDTIPHTQIGGVR